MEVEDAARASVEASQSQAYATTQEVHSRLPTLQCNQSRSYRPQPLLQELRTFYMSEEGEARNDLVEHVER